MLSRVNKLEDVGNERFAVLGVLGSEGLLVPTMMLESTRANIAKGEESEGVSHRRLTSEGKTSPFDDLSKEVGTYR